MPQSFKPSDRSGNEMNDTNAGSDTEIWVGLHHWNTDLKKKSLFFNVFEIRRKEKKQKRKKGKKKKTKNKNEKQTKKRLGVDGKLRLRALNK